MVSGLLQMSIDAPLLPRRGLLRQPPVHRFHHAPHALPLVASSLPNDYYTARVIPNTLRSSWWELSDIPLL